MNNAIREIKLRFLSDMEVIREKYILGTIILNDEQTRVLSNVIKRINRTVDELEKNLKKAKGLK